MSDDETLTTSTLLPFLTRIVACFAYTVFGSTETDVDVEEIVVVPRLDAAGETLHIAIDFEDNARRRTITDPDVLQNMIDDAIAAYCAGVRAAVLRVAAAQGVDVHYSRAASNAWTSAVAEAVARPERCLYRVIDAEEFDVYSFSNKAFMCLECAVSSVASIKDDEIEHAMYGLSNALSRHRVRCFSSQSKSWLRGFSHLRQCSALEQHAAMGVDWCACVNVCVRLASGCVRESDDDIERGSVHVFVNGSMLSRKETHTVVAHLWTLDDALWAPFALPPLRWDARRDAPNAGHAVFYTSAAASDARDARVSHIAIHFMTRKGSLRDMHAATMVFSHADSQCRTSTLLNPIPVQTSSALITAGVFDALRLLKRDDATMFATREEMRVRDAAIESARAALGCLVEPVTESTRAFLAEQTRVRGTDWQSQLLHTVGRLAAFRDNERVCERILRVR